MNCLGERLSAKKRGSDGGSGPLERGIYAASTREVAEVATMQRHKCRALAPSLLALAPNSLWACAACYGQSDAPLAQGMNWGILSLLTVVVMVLGGIGAFFVYLARKSVAVSAAQVSRQLLVVPTNKV